MHIILFGTGCDSCRELARNIEEAINLCEHEVTFEKTSDLNRMLSYGIKSTPSVVVNEKVISVSKPLSIEEITALINAIDSY